VLYLSKVNQDKGALELLSAFQACQTKAILVYVGSGQLFNELQETVKHRMVKNVFIFGFQNLSQVPKFYSIADIFVIFSRQEAWGLVINEAMCFGLPVISTNTVMAAYDLLRNGENGFIIDWGDIAALRDSMLRLIGDQALRQAMGERSLKRIAQWNNDLAVAGFLRAFDALRKK
jgi:glycosyltransferase involved in cell wall biosynthesis